MDGLLQRAAEVYALAYFGLVLAAAVLEWVIPCRPVTDSLKLRWFGNISLSILDTVVVRSLFPMLAVGWAAFCHSHGWGLFSLVTAPAWLAFIVSVLALDFLYYAQHYTMHRVPVLWRLHRTHHTDQEFDFSTGLRFHPLETIVTTAAVFGFIMALGAPPAAVFVLQLFSVAVSFIDHANVRVPASLDRVLRLVFVTPDMHRIHHSQDAREGQSNFANLFSWWDRLFATYIHESAAGSAGMTFGVEGFANRKHLTLPWMLAQPFLREDDQASAAAAPVNDVAGR
jgi:sterol desaturase/sphingolipid hydroxylase (fatty acid hydroxylase superfamily)